jgi:hypothetical protein
MRIRLAFVAAIVLCVSTGIAAQEKQIQEQGQSKEANTQAYILLLRSDLKASKRALIKESMQLDVKQAEVFWPIYNQFDAEQSKITDQRIGLIKDYAQEFLTMNDQKADQLAQRALAIEDERQALRKKYYDVFKKALPAILVVRFFQLENQIELITDLQIDSNLPIIEEAPPKQ